MVTITAHWLRLQMFIATRHDLGHRNFGTSELLAENNAVSDVVGRFYDSFVETLNSDLTLEEILPFYVKAMPYYQRLHANALSRSIRGAVTIGGQTSVQYRDWQTRLPQLDRVLLSFKN